MRFESLRVGDRFTFRKDTTLWEKSGAYHYQEISGQPRTDYRIYDLRRKVTLVSGVVNTGLKFKDLQVGVKFTTPASPDSVRIKVRRDSCRFVKHPEWYKIDGDNPVILVPKPVYSEGFAEAVRELVS